MDHLIEFLKLREKTASLSIGFEILQYNDDDDQTKEKQNEGNKENEPQKAQNEDNQQK